MPLQGIAPGRPTTSHPRGPLLSRVPTPGVQPKQILFDPNPGAPLVGDVNGDGVVDLKDVEIVKAAMGTTAGMPGYDPRADVVRDGVVDRADLAVVVQAMEKGLLP